MLELAEKVAEPVEEKITFTKEDFLNVKDRFLEPCPVYVAGRGFATPITHSSIYITVSTDGYRSYDYQLKGMGATKLATKVNPNSGRDLKLWFLENKGWDDLTDTEKKQRRTNAIIAGNKASEYCSICDCCGSIVLTNPFTALHCLLANKNISYSYIVVSDTVLKLIKSCALKDYITFEFTYRREGKSFSILSFREDTIYSNVKLSVYKFLESLKAKMDSSIQYSNVLSGNAYISALGINLNEYIDLVGGDVSGHTKYSHTTYYLGPDYRQPFGYALDGQFTPAYPRA